jgi:hypothetical protein
VLHWLSVLRCLWCPVELPGEHNAAAQVLLLQRDLAEAHAELAATQERLAELETLQVRQHMLQLHH